ncbi:MULTISPECIES: hypothetical protein [unclassified Streptomyces]|jgi:hypothetical protein|uniref:hypothetical protein n=1 Tax=Streptomyces sp. NPDC005955 TaxID=3364738 RepID=UPI003679B95C
MPRPTAAQIAYGTATVVCSTLAMLLLSRTSSGIAVAVIAIAALGLGLLVAVTVPLPKSRPRGTPVAARAATPRIPGQRTASAPAARDAVDTVAGVRRLGSARRPAGRPGPTRP